MSGSKVDELVKLLGVGVLGGAIAAGVVASLNAASRRDREGRYENFRDERRPTGSQKTLKDVDLQALGLSTREGFSMSDARAHAQKLHKNAKDKTPKEVLDGLQKGNTRFWTGGATRPEVDAFHRRALIMQQYPSVVILGCSDSRVPIEIIFDQGLGDIFVIRVAGNLLDKSTMASLEYAVAHLKVKVLMILGHEGCGAVRAAIQLDKCMDCHPENLSTMLTDIKKGLNEKHLACIQDHRARDRESVVMNVRAQLEVLEKESLFMDKVKAQELIVVGAFYEISSGIVDFFHSSGEAVNEDA